MHKILLTFLLTIAPLALKAQGDVEYKMEIGVGAGAIAYVGDFNGSPLKGMQPAATVVLRRTLNPYMGFRLAATYGNLKGSSTNTETYYHDYTQQAYDFKNTVVDLGLTYEYNFWPYGTGREYRGAKRLTPFIFIGIGGTYVKSDENVFTANIPVGAGVKYKIADRLNFGLQWGMHFTLSDKLDGIKDPYYVKSTGLFKNADGYGIVQATITYSFLAKCKTCHNDDD